MAKTVYGYDSIDVADAYRSFSKALIINKLFDNDIYYEYAHRALKIAIDHFSPESPKLVGYQLSFCKLKTIYIVNLSDNFILKGYFLRFGTPVEINKFKYN